MSEPSSASSISNSHLNYGGSRKEASRFRYKSKTSLSGFVELIPRCVPTPHELFEWLKNCKKTRGSCAMAKQQGLTRKRWESFVREEYQGIPEVFVRKHCHAQVLGV